MNMTVEKLRLCARDMKECVLKGALIETADEIETQRDMIADRDEFITDLEAKIAHLRAALTNIYEAGRIKEGEPVYEADVPRVALAALALHALEQSLRKTEG